MNFNELKGIASKLREKLSKYDISEICRCAYFEIINNKNLMHSRYKQCDYIISLGLSIEKNSRGEHLDGAAWKSICTMTEDIYNYYVTMHFPKAPDFESIPQEKHRKGSITIPTFLLNLCSGKGYASPEQIIELSRALYSPYSDRIKSCIGVDVNQLIEIFNFIISKLENNAKNTRKLLESWHAFRNDKSLDKVIPTIDAEIISSAFKINIITLKDLNEKFSTKNVEEFIKLVSQERINSENDVLLPTENLSILHKPLIKLSDAEYFLITGNHLALAIQENLYKCLEEMNLLNSYNKDKSIFLERESLKLLKKLFGDGAKYYSEIYETPDNNEHDILILYKRCLLIIECKAKRIRKNFRNIEQAYLRIKDDFKGYIQEGYDQARNLEKYIFSNEKTALYNKNRGIECVIDRSKFDRIEKIVITFENEGMLATKLSDMLELDSEDQFPYCINFYDLMQLAVYKNQLGITPEKILQYLAQRKLIHDKHCSDDELDIWGFYLKKSSLREIVDSDVPCIIGHDSDVFDNAYLGEETQIQSLPKKKIGRNELCPCGSRKKYKKCHLNR